MTSTNFDHPTFKLHKHLINICQQEGFTAPTPIQEQAIPIIAQGKDLMACAQTGTGKTAAFTLPLISQLLMNTNTKARGPKALILSPTRELAEQILASINIFTKGTQIKTGVVVGGMPYGPQLRMLSKPLDILVATPGRLIDHVESKKVYLGDVQTFILDEADRMLDMGFVKPVEQIAQTTAHAHQTLLFSATFSPEVEKLAKRFMNNPEKLSLAASTKEHTDIEQSLYYTPQKEQKISRLKELLNGDIKGQNVWQAIVFMRTKHAADRMAKTIGEWGHQTAALHGDMKQSKRKKVTEQMHKGTIKVLVATDVAARGLDVKALSHVVNYDLPQVAEDYIHRVGRTGRAGAKGAAISFVSNDERRLLSGIENLIGRKIDVAGGDIPKGGAPRENTNGRARSRKPSFGKSFAGKPSGGKPAGGKPTGGKRTGGNGSQPWQNKSQNNSSGKRHTSRSQKAL